MQSITMRKAEPGEMGLAISFYYHLFHVQFDFLPCREAYFLHNGLEI
jgi:hypothetical protein